MAQRLAGWEAEIVAFDPYVPAEAARELGVELVGLGELLARSDVVASTWWPLPRPMI